jgi:hypothetical protein
MVKKYGIYGTEGGFCASYYRQQDLLDQYGVLGAKA